MTMVTYVAKISEVVKETERALPEMRLLVLDGVGTIEYLPRGFPSHYSHNGADDELSLVKAFGSFPR